MGPKIGPNPPKMGKITIIQELNGLEYSFLFPSPLFSTLLSQVIIVSNILNHWLPQNLAPGAPNLAQTHQKMDKITIFQELKGLEYSFLFLSPHFPPQ